MRLLQFSLFAFRLQRLIQIQLLHLAQIQLQLQPPDPEPAPAPEPEPAPAPAPTPEKKSTLPATGVADVVVPASVLAVSGLGFVAASRKVRK